MWIDELVKKDFIKRYIIWRNKPPFDGWHSWDTHPWKHPWLTSKNLSEMRDYSKVFREKIRAVASRYDANQFRFGFCGNIANNLYSRAVPLRRAGVDVTLFMHPQDNYAMSHPCWEEFDGVVSGTELDVRFLNDLPNVGGVEHCVEVNWSDYLSLKSKPKFMHLFPFLRYPQYRAFMPLLQSMQKVDSLLCAQVPYVGYLSGKPYITAQVGGDIWFEASRGDELGALQRAAFASAKVFIVSNPWSFAHARRFGFRHLIYLPLMLDQEVYSPGFGAARKEWEAKSGGSFFVLTTSRLDEVYKGSRIGLEGVAAFIKKVPQARFVLVGWGKNKNESEQLLKDLGIADKVIWMPISGKARLRDYLRGADCFMDQFVLGYFGGAGLEAMACGLPVIGRIEKDQYAAICETGAPPILNAETSEEVLSHLLTLFHNPTVRSEISLMHRDWFVNNHGSKRWLPDYQSILITTALNQKIDFSHSPLRQALSNVENDYHEEGLRRAPEFPNYL